METYGLCQAADHFGRRSQRGNGEFALETKLPAIRVHDDVTVLDMGDQEIWDGADLTRLRQALVSLIEDEKCRSIGLDMSHVKHLWSGFFGQLCDWGEKGVAIRLYSPQPRVRAMLWFRAFFEAVSDDSYILLREPKQRVLGNMFPDSVSVTEAIR